METPRSLSRSIASTIATYGAWLIVSALGVAICAVWRTALLQLYLALRLDKWGFAAFNNAIVIVLILGWLVMVMLTEGWLRNAAHQGVLGRRFRRLVLAEGALLIVGFAFERLV